MMLIIYDGYNRLDPCSIYTTIDDHSRSHPGLPNNARNDLLCDYHLTNDWYRFKVKEINHVIKTKCVQPGQCGTIAPGWLRGQHPEGMY